MANELSFAFASTLIERRYSAYSVAINRHPDEAGAGQAIEGGEGVVLPVGPG
jgi:hypothetical protein